MLDYDVCTIIATYVDYTTASNMELAIDPINPKSVHLTQYCNPVIDFIPKLRSKFESLGLNDAKIDQFITILKNYNASLSGSFVLNIITGDSWEPGDIDIYAKDDTEHHLLTELCKFLNIKTCDVIGYHDYDKCCETMHSIKNSYSYKKEFVRGLNPINIGKVYAFPKIFGMKFQIIYLTTQESIFEYIDRTYDMDFCKNVFDGHYLYVRHPDSIRYRRSDVSNLKLPSLKFSRVLKYTKRGFDIRGLDDYYRSHLSFDATFKLHELKGDSVGHRFGHRYVWSYMMEYHLRDSFKFLNFVNLENMRLFEDFPNQRTSSNLERLKKHRFRPNGGYKFSYSKKLKNSEDCRVSKGHALDFIIQNKNYNTQFDEDFISMQTNVLKAKTTADAQNIVHNWVVDTIRITCDSILKVKEVLKSGK